jgi:CRP/FNR family transcriptional regulator
VLPFDAIEELGLDNRAFQHTLLCLLAREITCRQNLMLVLASMRAEQRLAAFFLDLARRYHDLGYSSCEFVLRMTREEIGSYIGLQLETVSRLCTRFQEEGLIQVQGRAVKLLDRIALKRIVGTES